MWLKADEVEPPSAPLEAELLVQKLGKIPDVLPWQIGRGLLSPDPANMFNMMESLAGQTFFGGPSGNASDMLQLANLFEGYGYLTPNWYCTLAACIVWLAGVQHHSTDEVMIAAEAYGVKYDATANPDEMLELALSRM